MAGGLDPIPAAAARDPHWSFPADRWNSALLYGFVHTLAALVAVGVGAGRLRLASGWTMILGVVLFSGVQIATLLWAGLGPDAASATDGAQPTTPFDVLSPLVPVGGVAFMAGWVLLGASALVGAGRRRDPPGQA